MANVNIPETLTLSEDTFQISALRTLLAGYHRILWKELYYEQMSGQELQIFRDAYNQLRPIRERLGLNV